MLPGGVATEDEREKACGCDAYHEEKWTHAQTPGDIDRAVSAPQNEDTHGKG